MGEDPKAENPNGWEAYIDAVDMITAASMSSDETETEATRDKLKVVCSHEKTGAVHIWADSSKVWIKGTSLGRKATSHINASPRKVTGNPRL